MTDEAALLAHRHDTASALMRAEHAAAALGRDREQFTHLYLVDGPASPRPSHRRPL